MRYFFLIILSVFLMLNTSKAQSLEDGYQVNMSLETVANATANRLILQLDPTAKDGFDTSAYDTQKINLTTASYYVVSRSSDGFALSKDSRSYVDRLYVDYPVEVKLPPANEIQNYSFRASKHPSSSITEHTKAVSLVLIDKKDPNNEIYHDLTVSDYKYTHYNTTNTEVISNRFVLRIYVASLLKENVLAGDWMEAANWYGGVAPGITPSYIDNQVIIPQGASVIVPDNKDIVIGTLYNSGDVIINQNATFTTESTLILDSTKKYHK